MTPCLPGQLHSANGSTLIAVQVLMVAGFYKPAADSADYATYQRVTAGKAQ